MDMAPDPDHGARFRTPVVFFALKGALVSALLYSAVAIAAGAFAIQGLAMAILIAACGVPLVCRSLFRSLRKIDATVSRLQESEMKYRSLFNNAADLIALVDRQGTIVDFNRKFEQDTGHRRDEFIGRSIFSAGLLTPESAERAAANLERLLSGEGVFTFEVDGLGKDGRVIPYELKASAVYRGDEVVAVQANLRNLTERKHYERSLKDSEERYRQLFDHAPAGIYEVDFSTGKFVNVNEVMTEYSGYSHEELVGKSVFDLLTEESQALFLERLESMQRGEPVPETVEYSFRRKDGRIIWVLLNARHVRKDGVTVGANAVVHNITDRKTAEEALRQSEEKYRTIIESIEEGYFEVDLSGNLVFFNSSLARMTGFAKEELVGLNYTQYTTPKAARKMLRVFNRVRRTGKPSGTKDFDILLKDGRSITISFSASAILDAEGTVTGFRGLIRDVSEHRRSEKERQELEKRLQRARKMEAIGALAGGVAHDLNNILSGIVSYPDLLLMDLPADSPLRNPIQTIYDSGKRAAAIVQDLLTLARRGVAVSEVVDLNRIVRDYLKSPEFIKLQSFHPRVDVTLRLDGGSANVLGSPIHLAKTVMNLVSNAAEAMPDGGRIGIETRGAYIDRPIKGYDQVQEGDYVVLTVADSGIGIAEEDLGRIFEPFFTKKKMGRSGTGLGMAVVWGTVKDHKGYIDVSSAVGRGTAFTLYFPATRQAVALSEQAAPAVSFKGRGEKILVVDDVRQQREIAEAILVQLGYAVKTAASGEEAVDLVKQQPFELVVLDMIMDPGLDGLETYQQMIGHRPGQRAIITSGFSETSRVREAQFLGAGRYVKKPYTLQKLGMAVKAELYGSRPLGAGSRAAQ
jgi:PAS domain S-box-containing protein